MLKVIRCQKINIKTTTRHHYTTIITMANIKNAYDTKCWQESGTTEIIQMLVV